MPSTRKMRRPGEGLDASQVKVALRQHAEELFRAAFGEPVNPRGQEWRFGKKGAISMKMHGEKRGLWHDFSADAGGDLFDLVAITRCGLLSAQDDFPKVLEEAGRMTGQASGRDAWRGFPKPPPPPAENTEKADRERRTWHAVTVMALIDRIKPAAGTPAAAYLAGRGVTDLPDTGMGWLPPVPGMRALLNPRSGALLVWALNAAGWPTGGQRILVTRNGRPSRARSPKPSFGRVGGFPARFPAREGKGAAPLVVAEGPESALSVRQATGHEAWAVFGVGNFKSAPLPKGRTVILAPDRDARDGKAGRAFARATFLQRERGIDLLIAEAPEPDGSKRDLNDTLRRAGNDAVRAAIEAARPVTNADIEEVEDR